MSMNKIASIVFRGDATNPNISPLTLAKRPGSFSVNKPATSGVPSDTRTVDVGVVVAPAMVGLDVAVEVAVDVAVELADPAGEGVDVLIF